MNASIKWDVGWLLILGLLFSYELYAIFAHDPSRPTLTHLTVAHVPVEITLTFLFWLWLHFALHYLKRL